MTLPEALSWVEASYGRSARGVLPRLRAQVEALAASSARGPFLVDYFEAALNSVELRGRVKLVHVAGLLENAAPALRRELALKRRQALEALFERWGLDAASLGRMYDAVFGAGQAAFYPVASVEWDLAAGRFEEVSLYCDEEPARAAAALGRDLGLRESSLDLGRLYAVGFDFRPGKPARLKLYHGRPASGGALGRAPSGRAFLALPERHRPADFLTLKRMDAYAKGGRRTALRAGLRPARKVYLCYLSRVRGMTDCGVEALASACAPGALKDFLGELRACAAGQYVDYLGCEGRRFEAYVAKPAWRSGPKHMLQREPGRLWVLP